MSERLAQPLPPRKSWDLLTAMRPASPLAVDLDPRGEFRLLMWLVAASLVIHLGVILVDLSSWLATPLALPDEWAMDVDLLGDPNLAGAAETALPDAKKAEIPEMPNLLPQLPKNFSIEDQKKEPDDAMIDPDKAPEDKPKAEDTTTADNESANKLKMDELRKRRALEQMRQRLKDKAATMRAPTKAEVAELRDRLAAAGIVGGGGSGAGPFQKCRAMITAMMREAYSMPDAYNIRGQKMEVILHARLAQNGSLVKSEIAQPSGNDVFDNYALKALRDAAPFPEDCKEVAGETITFRFRP